MIESHRNLHLAGLAAVLLIHGWLAQGTAAGAVIVLSNRTQHTVRFTLEIGGEGTLQRSLDPGQLIPLHVADKVSVAFGAGGAAVSRSLEVNSLYTFSDRGGRLELKQATFCGRRSLPRSPAGGKAKAPGVVTIPVKLLVDQRHPAVRSVWESRMRSLVETASRAMEGLCRVRFEPVAVDTWQANAPRDNYSQLAEEFRRKVRPGPGWLAIGIISQFRVADRQLLLRHEREPFFRHLLLPEVQRNFSRDDQLALLIHELGHYLGAVHSLEPKSIMRTTLFAGQRIDVCPSMFDPENVLVMNLVAEELRGSGQPRLDAMSRDGREFLRAIYAEMAQRRPADREFLRYADLLRPSGAAELRYVGQWIDGKRLGGTVGPWYETQSSPRLGGRELFDPSKPIRWLMMSAADASPAPDSCIEFVGGDRLPGEVTAFCDGTQSLTRSLPPYLEVAPGPPLDWSVALLGRSSLRITLPWLRRIIWKRAASRYEPRMVFLRDGRKLDFRSVRFSPTGIRILRHEGIFEFRFTELAELDMPAVEPWDAYFGQLAARGLSDNGRLARLESTGGLRVTSTTDRFQAFSRGRPTDPANWYHLVQPAWSLDPFWLGHATVHVREYFLAHEVPLSAIEPSAERKRPDAQTGPQWQTDHNIQGKRLDSGGQVYPWGIGVRVPSELVFPLPSCAQAFRARLGLDALADRGDRVKAEVFVDGGGKAPLYTSRAIGGNGEVLDTGRLDWKCLARPPSRLILRVGPSEAGSSGVSGFPPASRAFDWLEPLIQLDPEAVKAEVARRTPRIIPAWQGWEVSTAGNEPIQLQSQWDEADPAGPAYNLVSVVNRGLVRLSRKLAIGPGRDCLLLVVSCLPQSAPARIEVLAEAKPIVTYEIPVDSSAKTPFLAVSLAQYRGRKVTVDLVQRSKDGDETLVEWKAIILADQNASHAARASGSVF